MPMWLWLSSVGHSHDAKSRPPAYSVNCSSMVFASVSLKRGRELPDLLVALQVGAHHVPTGDLAQVEHRGL